MKIEYKTGKRKKIKHTVMAYLTKDAQEIAISYTIRRQSDPSDGTARRGKDADHGTDRRECESDWSPIRSLIIQHETECSRASDDKEKSLKERHILLRNIPWWNHYSIYCKMKKTGQKKRKSCLLIELTVSQRHWRRRCCSFYSVGDLATRRSRKAGWSYAAGNPPGIQ